MSEKALMDAILVAVSKLPETMIWRNNSGLLYTKRGTPVRASIPGAPDLICIYKGRFIGIEVKDGRGKQEKTQKSFERACKKAGGIYILARSIDEAVDCVLSIE